MIMSVQDDHGVDAFSSELAISHAHNPQPSHESVHDAPPADWKLADNAVAEPLLTHLLAEGQDQIVEGVPLLGNDVVATKRSKAELLDLQWNDMFQRLCRYREQYGDCLVPRSFPADKALGQWCGNQRMLRKRQTLQEDRLRKLEDVGFSFVADERYMWSGGRNKKHLNDHWAGMYGALLEYHKQHGHAVVPKGYAVVVQEGTTGTTTTVPLGRWVCRQRTSLSQGTLPAERKEQLDAVGFVWKPNAGSEGKRRTRVRCRGEASGTDAPSLPPEVSASLTSTKEEKVESPTKKRKSDGLAILAYVSSARSK
jgi:Helicase associated domain